MPSLASVSKIEDLAKRARDAARIAKSAQVKADLHRPTRDAAALAMLRAGAQPVEVYRLIGVSRGLFVRMARRPLTSNPPVFADPKATAAASAKECAKWDRLAEQARAVRDQAAYAMKDAGRTNADVARATGLTTARVAKLFDRRRAEEARAVALADSVASEAEPVAV